MGFPNKWLIQNILTQNSECKGPTQMLKAFQEFFDSPQGNNTRHVRKVSNTEDRPTQTTGEGKGGKATWKKQAI